MKTKFPHWHESATGGRALSRSLLLVSLLLGTVAGCTSVSSEPGSNLTLRADIQPLVDNIEAELDRVLPAAGMPPWTGADASATRARFQFVVAGWKGAEVLPGSGPASSRQVTKQVVLFADPETRRIALLVEVTDADGHRLPDRQAEIEELVSEVVSAERVRFASERPDVSIQQSRDQMAPPIGGG